MLVRLSFNSSNASASMAWEVIWYLLNNPSIDSIAALTSSAGWTASTFVLANSTPVASLNTSRSFIVRTNNPTNVQAHRYYSATTNLQAITLQFQVYDSTQKYYYQYLNNTQYGTVGTAVSPSFDTAPANSTAGSKMTLSNPVINNDANVGYYGQGSDWWFHITNRGMAFATGTSSYTSTTTSGFPSGTSGAYTLSPYSYHGPFVVAQYTRFDACNTAANGWIPVLINSVYNSVANPYQCLTYSTHLSLARNALYTNGTYEVPYRVMNAMNAAPTTASNTPPMSLTYGPGVSLGIGMRTGEGVSLTGSLSSTSVGGGFYGSMIGTTGRYPTSENNGFGFALHPIFWSHTPWNLAGGNVTDQSGYAIFNGIYQPGDEFTYGGKTYVIWPLMDGFSNNVGFAVPKE